MMLFVKHEALAMTQRVFAALSRMNALFLTTYLLAVCLATSALHASTYYLSPKGNDRNDGLSKQTAFRTLAAACRTVPAGPHTIRVGRGEFEEKESCLLPPGVSLVGMGVGQTIFLWKTQISPAHQPMKFDVSAFFLQVKGSENATISDFTVRGTLPDDQRAHGGIIAHEVKHLRITRCEFIGLEFTGAWLSQATKSRIDHCRMEDCGQPNQQSCSGALQVGDLTDCSIHHNVIHEHRGAYGIKSWKTIWTNPTDWFFLGQNKVQLTNCHFHDNQIDVRQQGAWGNGQPNMAIELWNSEPSDCSIHHNRVNGCVSLVEGGKAAKTIRVHHNLFFLSPGYSYAIEAGHHNMEIDHNVFRNGFYPIASFGHTIENLHVHHNTFDGIENFGICNMPGLSRFRFAHNTVVIKNDMHVFNIGSTEKSDVAEQITIEHNLFVKDGSPACAQPLLKWHGTSAQPDATIRDNAFWNWTADGGSPLSENPLLERGEGPLHLLKLPGSSPVRMSGRGDPFDQNSEILGPRPES